MTSASKLPRVALGRVNIFGSRKSSQTVILSKKIDIVTSAHIDEPPWDIVVDITDALNADSGRAKRVLAHLKKIFEKSFQTSLDNQQLYNCLTVIDSLFRNGNGNIISVLHSQFLSALVKLAMMADCDEKQKSLLQSNKKTCRDRVLSIIKQWASDTRISVKKYPQFRATFVKLQRDGLPFDAPKIETQSEQKQNNIRQQEQKRHKERQQQQQKQKQKRRHRNNNNSNHSVVADIKPSTPWEERCLTFGKWYKKKLKTDLFQLAEQIILCQDIIVMKNIVDAQYLCMELRESQRRLIAIIMRCPDAGPCDSLMQVVVIIASLLECYQKLSQGEKYQIPGVSKTGLHSILEAIFN